MMWAVSYTPSRQLPPSSLALSNCTYGIPCCFRARATPRPIGPAPTRANVSSVRSAGGPGRGGEGKFGLGGGVGGRQGGERSVAVPSAGRRAAPSGERPRGVARAGNFEGEGKAIPNRRRG